jgi:hypothetical protein
MMVMVAAGMAGKVDEYIETIKAGDEKDQNF